MCLFVLFVVSQRNRSLWNIYALSLDRCVWMFGIQIFGLLTVYSPLKSFFVTEDVDMTSILQFVNYCILFPVVIEILVCGIFLRFALRYCNLYTLLIICASIISIFQERQMLIFPSIVFATSICYLFYRTHSLIYVVFVHIIVNCSIFVLNLISFSKILSGIGQSCLYALLYLGTLLYILMLRVFFIKI